MIFFLLYFVIGWNDDCINHVLAYQPVDLRLSRLAPMELMYGNFQLRVEHLEKKSLKVKHGI